MSEKWDGHQLAPTFGVGLTLDRAEEVGDVAESVAVDAVQVGVVVAVVHLVDPHAVQLVRSAAASSRASTTHARFAVGQRDQDVGPDRHQLDDRLDVGPLGCD